MRKYKVAGIVFGIIPEEPFIYMEYSPTVLERIAKASRGEAGLDIRPTRAGDDVPHRTLIQNKEDVLPRPAELAGFARLDLSQYEPFYYDGPQEPDFSITIKRGLEKAPELGEKVAEIHSLQPYYTIYEHDGCPRYTLDENPETGEPAAILAMSSNNRNGVLYTAERIKASAAIFQLSTALMLMFTYNAASKGMLLIHASVIGFSGKANIFLGKSGTGKSTHSRLWLENIPGADLLNDDNPILGFNPEGKLCIYGSPWSGKTPCYRNVCAEVNAIVRLEQAPQNSISLKKGIEAYTTLVASVSAIRWNRFLMDNIIATVEKASQSVPVYQLDCLPNPDAARLCQKTTFC